MVPDEMRYGVNIHWEEEDTETAQNRRCGEFVAVMTWDNWQSGVVQQTKEHSSHHVVSKGTDSDVPVVLFDCGSLAEKKRILRIDLISVSIPKK